MTRPVRLTSDAAALARGCFLTHGTIDEEKIVQLGDELDFNARTQAILQDALRRAGVDGVRALCHIDGRPEE